MEFLRAVREGLALFGRYAVEATLDYFPNSYENGTPKNPSHLYFLVTAPDFPEAWEKDLLKLGWVKDDDFVSYWVSEITIMNMEHRRDKMVEKIISDIQEKVKAIEEGKS